MTWLRGRTPLKHIAVTHDDEREKEAREEKEDLLRRVEEAERRAQAVQLLGNAMHRKEKS